MRSKNQRMTTLTMLSASEQALPQTSLWQRVALVDHSKAKTPGFRPDWLEAERELAAVIIDEKLAA